MDRTIYLDAQHDFLVTEYSRHWRSGDIRIVQRQAGGKWTERLCSRRLTQGTGSRSEKRFFGEPQHKSSLDRTEA
jgi:hypothetical protein